MSAVRTVSTLTREVATRLSWITARTISPVRPMPPAVAQNSSGSDCLGHRAQLAAGQDDVGRPHVPGEAAGHVVVLAVHVGRDRAADRHLPGARGHRHEPAGRQARHHELLQADAGLAGRQAGGRVQVEDPVQPGGGDHHAAVALRGVVVAAAEPAGDRAAAAGGGLQQPGRAGDGGWLGQFGPGRRDPAPAGEADGAAWHSVRIVAVGLKRPPGSEPSCCRIAAALAGLLRRGRVQLADRRAVRPAPSRPAPHAGHAPRRTRATRRPPRPGPGRPRRG